MWWRAILVYMNKRAVTFSAVVGMTVGGFVPMLWGDDNFFGGMSLLLTLVGGIAGIWLAVWLGKRYF